jgi:hypothetical protein
LRIAIIGRSTIVTSVDIGAERYTPVWIAVSVGGGQLPSRIAVEIDYQNVVGGNAGAARVAAGDQTLSVPGSRALR